MNRSLTAAQIYDGEFFEIVGSENDILIVRCNICTTDGSDAQLLRTSMKSNGNILKHIKRRHPEQMEKIKETKCVKTRAPRMMKGEMNDSFKRDGKSKQDNADDTDEDRLMLLPDEYIVEPIDTGDSDQEEYITYEVERRADESIEILDDSQMDSTDYDIYRRNPARKRPNEFNISDIQPGKRPAGDSSLVEFQKKLLQAEHDEMRKLRNEKHMLEIAILKAELAHKTMEHQKRMEVLNKKLNIS